MGDRSKIEWTNMTWNPVTGCTVLSAGCAFCYAMKLAGDDPKLKHHPSREGLTKQTSSGPVWTGEVRFNQGWLIEPLRKQAPRLIFVCAHGDLFHDAVQVEWIDKVFAVMALAPRHTFQILTKRPQGMRSYIEALPGRIDELYAAVRNVNNLLPKTKVMGDDEIIATVRRLARWHDEPLPNVWCGTSVEDQATADERLPVLLATVAALHWCSYEPALGPVDWTAIEPLLASHRDMGYTFNALNGDILRADGEKAMTGTGCLDWIVAGGESEQPGARTARPSHPEWFRLTREQCEEFSTHFMLKQWGNWHPKPIAEGQAFEIPAANDPDFRVVGYDGKPGSLRSPIALMQHVARKHKAGALLDGVAHLQVPGNIPAEVV